MGTTKPINFIVFLKKKKNGTFEFLIIYLDWV